MRETILVTGGAGFIGRHVVTELQARGHKVRVLDVLLPQVHGEDPSPEVEAELIRADVRDAGAVRSALEGCDSVIHLAADVGVGQSMYEVERYVSANELGTAVLMQALIAHPVRRIVTASSMSIYGEGLYRTADGALVEDAVRDGASRAEGWDPVDERGAPLTPCPTPEWKRPRLSSVYALNKYAQEQATHIVAGAYDVESVCLRLFNVYGSGQALSNPYTGVLAIFASRLMNGKPPLVYEDGQQRRDFVHVRDVARAFADALGAPEVSGTTLNIGSGVDRTVEQVGSALARALAREDLQPDILGKVRKGDIRHCFCDTTLANDLLGFAAGEDFERGLEELALWVARQQPADRVHEATRQLLERGLVA